MIFVYEGHPDGVCYTVDIATRLFSIKQVMPKLFPGSCYRNGFMSKCSTSVGYHSFNNPISFFSTRFFTAYEMRSACHRSD